MKALGRAVVVLVGLCVFASGVAMGQDARSPEAREAVDRAEQDVHAAEKALRELERRMQQTTRGAKTDAHPDLQTFQVQLQAIQRDADKARQQLEKARSDIQRKYRDVAATLSLAGGERGGGAACLVIPSGQIEASELEAIIEDMAVMQRILDKELEREFGKDYERLSGGGPFSFTPTPSVAVPQSIYLDGYGALFLASVKFALAAAPPTNQVPEEVEEPESRWEQTRRELYGGPLTTRVHVRASGVVFAAKPSGSRYDRDEVEKLEQALLTVLREASNIRALRPDDAVTVAVLGGPTGGIGTVSASRMVITKDGRQTVLTGDPVILRSRTISPYDGTVLTIRVTKADADAFAKGELTEEQFRLHATITAYGLPSAGSPGVRPEFGGGMMPGMAGFGPMAAPEVPAARRRAR